MVAADTKKVLQIKYGLWESALSRFLCPDNRGCFSISRLKPRVAGVVQLVGSE